ncbi:GDSL-type esterase/lipase family protein [Paenibacillus taichungensis]|uniref:stalk domain-containing protein n=1 Tax=Paenibacillus taichungensis TaxID=484184 RepID=UPI002DB5DBF1|nr:stalk domain-containing protein [Paenibacillus taichungensis]MEC0105519.1 GDSL-type esterase/lipase family protein [Paenibacillus taichungensis]MEC0198011.1 GDSL-type esterase/lipase family protein [Paenibacillus taichungensis]
MKRRRIWRSTAAGLTASMLAGMLILASSAQSAHAADSNTLPAGSVTSSLPLQKDAVAVTKDFRLVTLGDSITVGYEPNLKELPYGYVERLQEQGLLHGRTQVDNYGIAGLKSSGLKNFADAIKEGKALTSEAIQPSLPDPRAAQVGANIAAIRESVAGANLVAITIGGNDVSELLGSADKLSDAELEAKVKELLSSYTANVSAVINDIHETNPNAKIVIADQYQPMPEVAGKALYAKLMEASQGFTATIDGIATEFSAKGIDVKVAHVAKEFVGGEGTMTHMIKDRDFHPNQFGYEAIAQVFAETIWGDYTKLTAPAAGQPMNIIVSGKTLDTPYKPINRNGKNFVAIQDIVNAVGATTVWDNKTSTATITYGDRKVAVKIGATAVQVNGASVAVDTPAFLSKVGTESKTYVPLAMVAEGLGFDVQYVAKLKTVFVNP